MEQNSQLQGSPASEPTIIINQSPQKNSVGTAGFVPALVGFFLCWVLMVNWILWLLGLILSFVGVFRNPKDWRSPDL